MQRRLLVICGVLVLVALFPLEALAASGGDPGPIPPTKHVSAHDLARGAAKDALAHALTLRNEGIISVSQFNSDVSTFLAKWGKATFASPGLLTPLSSPSAQTLPVAQFPETNPSGYCQPGYSCYCGPASAVSVLRYLQPVSHDGETLTDANGNSSGGQFGLAGNYGSGAPWSYKYLETNVRGGETPWYSGGNDWPMSQSFNYWISGSYSGFPYYTNYRPTSASNYESDLVADIWSGGSPGYPLAGDVEEIAGGLHLPGHPQNIEIQHWIAMFGYGSNGVTTDYVDPVAGSPLNGNYGFNVAPYNYGYASGNIYTLVTDAGPHGGPYGIVW